MNRLGWIFGFLLVAPAAEAREFSVHGGKLGTMRVRGVAEKAVKLVAGVGGWYVTLDVPGDGAACSVELRDVSPLPPHQLPKWVEHVPNVGETSTITLEPTRYVGSHTYRLSLRCGLREVSRAVVHLLPPADADTQLRFDMAQKTPDETAAPITTVPKGEL